MAVLMIIGGVVLLAADIASIIKMCEFVDNAKTNFPHFPGWLDYFIATIMVVLAVAIFIILICLPFAYYGFCTDYLSR